MKVDAASGITNKLQGVTETDENESESTSSDFDLYLKTMLVPDAANNVSEEELFAGLISERLKNLKGQEVSDKYNALLDTKKGEMSAADGYVPFEDCAKDALKAMRANGDITSEEADKIYSESFAGAQLDGNTEALYDNRGGAGDDTIAINLLEQALLSSRTVMEKFNTGTEPAKIRSLDEASNSKAPITSPVTVAPGYEDYPDNNEDLPMSEDDVPESDDTDYNEAPALDLALSFSKRILGQNLDKSLLSALSKDKDKEL